jgi:uncharacterized protein
VSSLLKSSPVKHSPYENRILFAGDSSRLYWKLQYLPGVDLMRCTVLCSDSKAYHYIYLAAGKEFDQLPAALQEQFPHPQEIMQLDLDQRKRLAHADIATVRKRLKEQGYYLQLPPELPVEEEIARRMP